MTDLAVRIPGRGSCQGQARAHPDKRGTPVGSTGPIHQAMGLIGSVVEEVNTKSAATRRTAGYSSGVIGLVKGITNRRRGLRVGVCGSNT